MTPDAVLSFLGGLLGALIGAVLMAVGLLQTSRQNAHLRRLPFLTKQMELSFEASEVAAKLATTRSQEAFDIAHERFLALFWGPLSIVENQAVSEIMIKFRNELDALLADRAPLPLSALEAPSYELAIEVKNQIKSWKIATDVPEKIERPS